MDFVKVQDPRTTTPTMRFVVLLRSTPDTISIEGTGLSSTPEVVQILGTDQVIAAFAVGEIIGVWPEPKT